MEKVDKIYEISGSFPKEERYSLTDQIRRSSRSVCANIAESWAKRGYPKAFVSKLTDSLAEEYETEVWLKFAVSCKYIKYEVRERIMLEYMQVRKMLIAIIKRPEKFCH